MGFSKMNDIHISLLDKIQETEISDQSFIDYGQMFFELKNDAEKYKIKIVFKATSCAEVFLYSKKDLIWNNFLKISYKEISSRRNLNNELEKYQYSYIEGDENIILELIKKILF